MKPLLQLPLHCDGCGETFTTSHALDCRRGGLVIHKHNEIRDLYDLSSIIWSQTVKEPLVRDGSASHPPMDTLIADLSIRGAWQPQVTALFDVRIRPLQLNSLFPFTRPHDINHCFIIRILFIICTCML